MRDLNVALIAAVTAQGDKESIKEFTAQLREQMGVVMMFKEKATPKEDILALLKETVI